MSWPTDPLDVRCVFAFGANLSASPSSWNWTDCTSDLRVSEGVSIKVGRSDRAKQPEPNQATFTLNDLNGQYTVDNPMGANYPNVVENVPGIIGVARNLNPTFEVNASDWFAQNGTVARSTVRAFSGSGSLLLTPSGGSQANAGVLGQIAVRPNGCVYVDAWVYSPTGWGSVFVSVNWYDGTGTYISTTSGSAVAVPAGSWTYLGAYLGPAPSNAANCAGVVSEGGAPAAGNTLWIDEARTTIPRLCGFVDGWTPQLNDTGTVVTCSVSMSGVRRRLGRGNPVLRSALYRYITRLNPASVYAYWPMEDGSQATSAALAMGNGSSMNLNTDAAFPVPQFASVSTVLGSDPLINMSNGTAMRSTIQGGSTSWSVQFVIAFGSQSSDSSDRLISTTDSNGGFMDLFVNPSGGNWRLIYIPLGSGFVTLTTATFSSTVNPFDGLPHRVLLNWTNLGANVGWSLQVDSVTVGSGSTPGTLGTPVKIDLGGSGGSSFSLALGHILVSAQGLDIISAINGYPGETAGARFSRLCSEEGVICATVNDQALSISMGPQKSLTLLDHLLECENADMGMAFEPFDTFGFGYIVRADLYNLPVKMTIDASSGQLAPPLAPLHDDLQRQNDVTVTRKGGSSNVRYVGDTSRGIYETSVTLNVQSDSQLLDVAAWLVHLGSPRKRLRHPSLSVNFTNSAATALAATFAASLGLGIRAIVANPPSQIAVPPDLLISGYTENLGFKQWVISLLGSPYEVWRVITIADTVLGRIETDGSTLSGGPYASNATSMTVVSSGGPWDTAAPPFDVDIGGEQCTVTAISGSTSPQTFTITRSVNGIVKQQTAGTSVALYRPGTIAL